MSAPANVKVVLVTGASSGIGQATPAIWRCEDGAVALAVAWVAALVKRILGGALGV